jgi:methyl-accepting chemotaxis protein
MLDAGGAARQAQQDGRAAADNMGDQLSRLSQVAVRVKDSLQQRAGRMVNRAHYLNAALLAASIVFSVALAGVVARRIIGPLGKGVAFAQAIAEGDLTANIDIRQRDEIGQLVEAMNKMAENLRQVIGQVADSSLELASAAEELSVSTSQMASSNEEVSSQSQTVASASEEMSATVEDVARSVTAVREASERASDSASGGAAVISQALEAMREIASVVQQSTPTVRALGEESQRISVVLDVIEDIADQTNLLALNAAIEAARAGEHGRGFAVVADEVRKLAERTVKATEEITQIIGSIQTETQEAVEAMDEGQQAVHKGTELGEKTGEASRDIETQVSQSSLQTQQIAAAIQQLSATTHDVATNMESLANNVEQNSSATTGIARTADTVAQKAESLKDLTGRFQI